MAENKWVYNLGYFTLLITGRGPPCKRFSVPSFREVKRGYKLRMLEKYDDLITLPSCKDHIAQVLPSDLFRG